MPTFSTVRTGAKLVTPRENFALRILRFINKMEPGKYITPGVLANRFCTCNYARSFEGGYHAAVEQALNDLYAEDMFIFEKGRIYRKESKPVSSSTGLHCNRFLIPSDRKTQ